MAWHIVLPNNAYTRQNKVTFHFFFRQSPYNTSIRRKTKFKTSTSVIRRFWSGCPSRAQKTSVPKFSCALFLGNLKIRSRKVHTKKLYQEIIRSFRILIQKTFKCWLSGIFCNMIVMNDNLQSMVSIMTSLHFVWPTFVSFVCCTSILLVSSSSSNYLEALQSERCGIEKEMNKEILLQSSRDFDLEAHPERKKPHIKDPSKILIAKNFRNLHISIRTKIIIFLLIWEKNRLLEGWGMKSRLRSLSGFHVWIQLVRFIKFKIFCRTLGVLIVGVKSRLELAPLGTAWPTRDIFRGPWGQQQNFEFDPGEEGGGD